MPRRSNTFQKLVTLLNRAVGGTLKVTESALLLDKATGEQREVDVLIESLDAGYNVRIGIEVSSTGRKADAPWVEKMRAKHADLDTDVLVLASEAGLTRAARKKAAHYNLRIIDINQAELVDWDLVLRLGSGKRIKLARISYNCELMVTASTGEDILLQAPPEATLSGGAAPKTIDSYVQGFLANKELRDKIYEGAPLNQAFGYELIFRFEEPVRFACTGGIEGKLNGFRIGLLVHLSANEIETRSGTYRGVPFVAGVADPKSRGIEYVVLRGTDGLPSGVISDNASGTTHNLSFGVEALELRELRRET